MGEAARRVGSEDPIEYDGGGDAFGDALGEAFGDDAPDGACDDATGHDAPGDDDDDDDERGRGALAHPRAAEASAREALAPAGGGALLAVDVGVRAGLACYGEDGRLRWHRSHNFGSVARLKRGAVGIVRGIAGLRWVVTEGDRHLASPWAEAARRQGAETRAVTAETWRKALLHLRERRSGVDAKHHADRVARAVIAWSGAPAPRTLRHDAAEAILIGLWGVLAAGWLPGIPDALRKLA